MVSEQVDLPCPHTFVAAERGEFGVDLGEPGPRRTERLEVDLTESVERGPLGRRGQQALVGVLTVEVDQAVGRLGERRHRGEATVQVRP